MASMYRRVAARAMTPKPSTNGDTMADETVKIERRPALSTKQGSTRGKNPRKIEYQAFDLEKPETLPQTITEFMDVSGVKDQNEIVALLVDGFNASQYSAASDEIGEFLNDAWDKDTQGQFRLAVRNMMKLTGFEVEQVVNMLKPAIDKAWVERVNAAKNAEAVKA
jgi:hypothetical protein